MKRVPQDLKHECVKRFPNIVGEEGAAIYGCREEVAADNISKRGEWNLIGYSSPCCQDLDGRQRRLLDQFWACDVAILRDVDPEAFGGLHVRDIFAVHCESESRSSVDTDVFVAAVKQVTS